MSEPTITIVMPAYNATGYLPRVLPPLIAMREAGEVVEVLVVDDCSTDETITMAKEMGATVLKTPENGGPGKARNLAAEHAIGDVIWLVDSDVIAAAGGAAIIREAFKDPDVHAVFGSYDDTPDGQSTVSKYKNLVHRFHHQRAAGDARTFWAGCGALRKDAFLRVGGFDVETYRVPSIEDIELGYRITGAGGRILVIPELEGKHLKVWTLPGAIHTDIFRRALPWARLMISREGVDDTLNLRWKERVRAGIAGLMGLSIFATLLAPMLWPLALLMIAMAFAANWRLFAFMQAAGGAFFAIRAVILHQLYLIYSACVFVWVLFEFHVLGVKDRLHVP